MYSLESRQLGQFLNSNCFPGWAGCLELGFLEGQCCFLLCVCGHKCTCTCVAVCRGEFVSSEGPIPNIADSFGASISNSVSEPRYLKPILQVVTTICAAQMKGCF